MTPIDAAKAGALSRKTFDVDVKSIDDAGNFCLYAAVFSNVDRGGDVIEPGAFDNLAEFAKDGWIALNHDSGALPVGYPTAAVQDAHGLKISGAFHTTAEAQACRTVVKERMDAGKAVKCSIGYMTNDESYEKVGGRTVRRLKSISVFECSFVNLPMNPAAEVQSVKAAAPPAGPDDESPPSKGISLMFSTKGGKPISKANLAALNTFSAAMDEHHDTATKCYKSLQACHKAMKATGEEFKAYLAAFDPDADRDRDSGEEAENDDDGDEKPSASAKSHSLKGRRTATCP